MTDDIASELKTIETDLDDDVEALYNFIQDYLRGLDITKAGLYAHLKTLEYQRRMIFLEIRQAMGLHETSTT